MTYTVVASGVLKSFADRLVLDHVDLAVETGSVLAMLGPNGAGKTTMVRVLATLVRPDAGTATIAGHDLRRDPIGVKRSISLTGQHAALDDVLTGEEHLEMMGRLRHLSRRAVRARSAELLAEFDLTAARGRRVGTYSGGMKRRLDLAISMIERPQVMFLDEPTTGLDPRSREQLWSTVRRIVDEGVTVLLTTQYLEEADQLADTVVVLDGGRVVARGTPDELKAGLGAEVVRLQFADEASYRRALTWLDRTRCDDRLRSDDRLCCDDRLRSVEVASDGSAAGVLHLLTRLHDAGTPAAKVSTHRPSLDDVFRSLTGSDRSRTTDGSRTTQKELTR